MSIGISTRRILFIGMSVCLLVAMALWTWRLLIPGPVWIHSYQESFAKENTDEWKALGGTWELANGMMRNDSDERGAKLLTGSTRWHNYSVEADVTLLGQGDAGLIIRSSRSFM